MRAWFQQQTASVQFSCWSPVVRRSPITTPSVHSTHGLMVSLSRRDGRCVRPSVRSSELTGDICAARADLLRWSSRATYLQYKCVGRGRVVSRHGQVIGRPADRVRLSISRPTFPSVLRTPGPSPSRPSCASRPIPSNSRDSRWSRHRPSGDVVATSATGRVCIHAGPAGVTSRACTVRCFGEREQFTECIVFCCHGRRTVRTQCRRLSLYKTTVYNAKLNEWPKNFDERPHRMRSLAVLLLRIALSLLLRTPQQRLSVFQWVGQPPKLPFPVGDFDPI